MEACDFIQLRTADIMWPRPEEFTITRVYRDRAWFASVLPKLQEFKDELARGVPLPPQKAKVVRRKAVKRHACHITSDDEDSDEQDDHLDPEQVAVVAAAVVAPGAEADVLQGVVQNVLDDVVQEVENEPEDDSP